MTEKYLIFTGQNCKWCDKAKALLVINDKDYQECNVSRLPDYRWLLEALDLKHVPQIFVSKDDKVTHIGGFLDLQAYLSAD